MFHRQPAGVGSVTGFGVCPEACTSHWSLIVIIMKSALGVLACGTLTIRCLSMNGKSGVVRMIEIVFAWVVTVVVTGIIAFEIGCIKTYNRVLNQLPSYHE